MTNKEYMPEVGKECEVKFKRDLNMDWRAVTPKYVGDELVVVTSADKGEQVYRKEWYIFRDKKTQADNEREEGADELQRVAKVFGLGAIFELIYDAGYRNGLKVGEKVEINGFIENMKSSPRYMGCTEAYLSENFDIFRKLES